MLPFEVSELTIAVTANQEDHKEVALSLVPGVLETWGWNWAYKARVFLGEDEVELSDKLLANSDYPLCLGGECDYSYMDKGGTLEVVRDRLDPKAQAKSVLP